MWGSHSGGYDISSCSPLKVSRNFGQADRLHLQRNYSGLNKYITIFLVRLWEATKQHCKHSQPLCLIRKWDPPEYDTRLVTCQMQRFLHSCWVPIFACGGTGPCRTLSPVSGISGINKLDPFSSQSWKRIEVTRPTTESYAQKKRRRRRDAAIWWQREWSEGVLSQTSQTTTTTTTCNSRI
jgi:hypothetical protein